MNRTTRFCFAALGLASALLAGCSRNPAVARKEFFDRGNQYVAQKKYKEAIVEYRNAIQVDPKFGEAHYKLAETYVQVEDPQNAFREYVRAADLLPAHADAQLKASAVLLAAGRFDEVKIRTDALLKRDAKNVEAQILRANAMAGLKDINGAITQVEAAQQADPSNSRLYETLGIMDMTGGKRTDAETAFKKAVEIAPQSATAQMALANYYWSIGRLDTAEASLKQVLALDPHETQALRALSSLYMMSNRMPQAEPYMKALADATTEPLPKLQLADYYLMTKQPKLAEAVVRPLVADKVTYAEATLRLALIEYGDGHADNAHKLIDQVLMRQPGNLHALLVNARLLMDGRKVDAALAGAKAAVAADPKSLEANILLASIYESLNQTASAIDAYSEALKIEPRTYVAKLRLARLHFEAGHFDTARQFAEQAVQAHPEDAEAHLLLARSLMTNGKKEDIARADGELTRMLAAKPDSSVLQSQMGLVSMWKRNPADARKYFTRAIELDPNSVEALSGLVALDFDAGKSQEARTRVRAMLAKRPSDPNVLLLAARIFNGSDDTAFREDALRKVIKTDASNTEAYESLGRIYYAQGHLDEAKAIFQTMVDRDPKATAAMTMLGLILQTQGRVDEAEKAYQKALDVDPRAAFAATNLAWLQAEHGGNLDIALQLAQTAKSQMPKRPEVSDILGWIYYKKDLAALAVRELKDSVDASPDNATYHYHLGLAYAKTGDKDNARLHLGRALKLKSDFDGAADARKVLSTL